MMTKPKVKRFFKSTAETFGAIVGIALGVGVIVLVGLWIVWVIASTIHDIDSDDYYNQVNHDFTVHCTAIGGRAIITDKDLCISPDGRVIDYER